MKIDEIRKNAYGMPYLSPAFSKGPYQMFNREFLIISYRTDPDLFRKAVPEPLGVKDPIVNYEFIRMPDSAGFGDYT
ncbi:MAG: acetoacetate decarboxylase family protein, partial [Fluviibacter sp.]